MQAEAVLVSEQDRQVTSLMLCVQALAQLQGEIQRLPSTLDALKQLEFFLRRDDPTKRTAHKHLAKWKTMQTYLLPLLVKYHKDEKLVFLILKLLVRLTLPIPQDVEFPLDELWNLQVYKSCFVLHQFAVPVIMMYLCKPLDSLDLDDSKLFDWLELIFSLFKNLLGVPSPKPADCATHPEFQHLHDKFLLVLYQNYFFDAIVTTSLLIVEEQDSSNVVILILLECLYHIFNREKPLDIMKSNESSEKLKNAVHFEKAKKLESSARTSLRHSRFGGTITVKSISNNGAKSVSANKFKHGDSFSDAVEVGGSADSPRYFFKDEVRVGLDSLASSFMHKSMNVLLGAVFAAFEKESLTTVNGDYMYFFSVIGFFLEYFKIAHSNDTELESEDTRNMLSCFEFLFNAEFVRFLLKKTKEYAESKTDQASLFSAIYCYKEFLSLLIRLSEKGNEADKRNARIMINNIFYHDEELKMLPDLLMHYDKMKQVDPLLLPYLVETMYNSLKLVESANTLFIAKKVRRHRKKAEKTREIEPNNGSYPDELLDDIKNTDDVSNTIETGENDDDMNTNDQNQVEDNQDEEIEETAVYFSNEEYDSDAGSTSTREQKLDFKKYLSFFTPNKIVQNCSVLLSYSMLLKFTRYSEMVAYVFNRISSDLELFPLFFQLSLFVHFEEIICKPCPSEVVIGFASDIMTKFFTGLQSNKCLIVEALFWKSRGLVRQLNGEDLPIKSKSKSKGKKASCSSSDEEEAEYVSKVKLRGADESHPCSDEDEAEYVSKVKFGGAAEEETNLDASLNTRILSDNELSIDGIAKPSKKKKSNNQGKKKLKAKASESEFNLSAEEAVGKLESVVRESGNEKHSDVDLNEGTRNLSALDDIKAKRKKRKTKEKREIEKMEAETGESESKTVDRQESPPRNTEKKRLKKKKVQDREDDNPIEPLSDSLALDLGSEDTHSQIFSKKRRIINDEDSESENRLSEGELNHKSSRRNIIDDDEELDLADAEERS